MTKRINFSDANNYLKLFLAAIILVYISGCSTTKETSKEKPQGLYYDPEGSTITTDKEIFQQHKRTFLFLSSGLYVSNEFEGARLNDFYKTGDSSYTAVIEPENFPINNSAWYAFKLWSDKKQNIKIKLIYKNGTQRYIPKLSRDKINWSPIDPSNYFNDSANGTAEINLSVGKDTLWVSGQELFTSSVYDKWENQLAEKSFVSKKAIGKSSLGKPINELELSEAPENSDYVFLIGRQHPPEVTGAIAMKVFIETIAGDTKTAQEFRKKFKTIAVPLANPDGVDNGHWRHNAHGIDLNRDWYYFNQPEPKAVKDEILKLQTGKGKIKFFIDFHSTQEDVFYITKKDTTLKEDKVYEITKEWLNKIQKALPNYHVNIDESLSAPNHPTSDAWAYNNFKIPALTYEMGDEDSRDQIKKVAETAALAMMKVLLDER